MKISVILTAFNREKYIPEALKAILNQTLDHSNFEVIVISNFKVSNPKDGSVFPIRNIIQSGSFGEYLYTAITAAQHEIIAFLDDDDIWSIDRLNRILEVFKSFQDVIYYHNSQWYIDGKGNIIRPLFQNPRRNNCSSLRLIPKSYRQVSKFINLAAGFNLSSISIRKSAFTDSLEYLRKINANPDGFFFWNAIAKGGAIYQDNLKLTGYRMHDQNLSLSKNQSAKGNEILNQIDTLNLLQKNLVRKFSGNEDNFVSTFIELQILEWKVHYLIVSRENKKDIVPYFSKILRLTNIWNMDLTTFRILLYLITYIIHPRLFSLFGEKVSIDTYTHE